MKRFSKVFISLICVICLGTSLTGCASSGNVLPGSGKAGEIDKTEWKEYDELLAQAQAESDMTERALLLHKAEDMLMDTGCMIPLFWSQAYSLIKNYVSNVVIVDGRNLDLSHVKTEKTGPGNSVSAHILSEISKADPAASSTTYPSSKKRQDQLWKFQIKCALIRNFPVPVFRS